MTHAHALLAEGRSKRATARALGCHPVQLRRALAGGRVGDTGRATVNLSEALTAFRTRKGFDSALGYPPGCNALVSSPASIEGFAPIDDTWPRAYSSGIRGDTGVQARGVVVWIILACLLLFIVWALLLHVLKLG